MVTYKLEHPYGKDYGTFKTIKSARANALKIIKDHYPAEGKHFAELVIWASNNNTGQQNGEVVLGDKYRGRNYDKSSLVDRFCLQAYWENYYVDMSDPKHDIVYRLNTDGSLGQKYVNINGFGPIPEGFAKTKEEAIRKIKAMDTKSKVSKTSKKKTAKTNALREIWDKEF